MALIFSNAISTQDYDQIESKLDWSLLFNIKDDGSQFNPKDDNWIQAMEEGDNGQVLCAGFHKNNAGQYRYPAWFIVSPHGEVVTYDWPNLGISRMQDGAYDDIVEGKDNYYIAGGARVIDHAEWNGADDPLVPDAVGSTSFITVLNKTTFQSKTYLLDDLDASGIFQGPVNDRIASIDVFQDANGNDQYIVVGGRAGDRGTILVYNTNIELQGHFFIQKSNPGNASLADAVNDVLIVPASRSGEAFDIIYTGEQHISTTACTMPECVSQYPEYTFENIAGNPLPDGLGVVKVDKDIIVGRVGFSTTNGLQEKPNFPVTFNYYNKQNPNDPSTLSVNPGKTFTSEYGPNTPGETGQFTGPFCHASPVINTFFDNTSYDLGRRLLVIDDQVFVIAWTNKFTEYKSKFHDDGGGRNNCGNYEHYYDAEAFVLKLDANTGVPVPNGIKHVAHFSGGDFRSPIELDNCGNIIVAGTTADQNFTDGGLEAAGGNRMFLIKLDQDLNVIWRKHFFQYGKGNCLFDAIPAADGGYYAGGNHTEFLDEAQTKEKESYIFIHLGPDQDDIAWDIDRQNSIYKVQGTEVWDQDMNVRAPVVIAYGRHLIIRDATISFADGQYSRDMDDRVFMGITVRPGGRLTLDNATLQGITDCSGPKMWEGITVEGNPDIPHQPPLGQGIVTSTNSSILNARIAIHSCQAWIASSEIVEDDGVTDGIRRRRSMNSTANRTGGKIYLSDTEFRNCYRSIIFMKYNQFANSSSMHNCAFLNDAPLIDPVSYNRISLEYPDGIRLGALTHVSIWANQGIDISNCRFTGLESLPQQFRANGVFSLDARYRIQGDDDSNTREFEHLKVGVSGGGIFGGVEHSISVEDCAFRDVSQSITLRNSVADRIKGNHIFDLPIPEPMGGQNFGIFGDGNQFSLITENDIDGINHVNVRGLVQRNSLESINQIYRNEFDNFYFSTQLEQNNAGLRARCNNYTNARRSAWNVLSNGDGELGDQGGSGDPFNILKADNQFFDPCNGDPLGEDPDIESDFEFRYFERMGNPNPAEVECVDPVVNFDPGGGSNTLIECLPVSDFCTGCDITNVRQVYNNSFGEMTDLGEYLRTALYRYDKSYENSDDLVELTDIEQVLLQRSDDLSKGYLASLYANRGETSASLQQVNTISSTRYHEEDLKASLPFLAAQSTTALTHSAGDELLILGQQGLDDRSSSYSRIFAFDQLVTGRYTPPQFLENELGSRHAGEESINAQLMPNEILVAPNPATGVVMISLPRSIKFKQIDLIDSWGHIVWSNSNIQDQIYMDVSNHAAGLYILSATSLSGETWNQKLVIQ